MLNRFICAALLIISFNASADFFVIWDRNTGMWLHDTTDKILYYPEKHLSEKHIGDLNKETGGMYSIRTVPQEIENVFGIWVIPTDKWLVINNGTKIFSSESEGFANAYVKQIMKDQTSVYQVRSFDS